jgi:hypothetical protein
MTDAEISAVGEAWGREARAAGINLPWDDIERALRELPAPEAWAVGDDATALFVLGPAGTLFTVAAGGANVTVTSRPLIAERLIVSLQLGARDTLQTRATRWEFRYADGSDAREPWQTISGSVSTDRDTGQEHLDERERFARVLAARAGWPGPERTGTEEPSAGQRSPAEGQREEKWWRARTDIWGRPLEGRR